MATTVARLQAVLAADTRDFDRAMGRSESKMGSAAKMAGKAGLAGAVLGLGAAVKVGIGEFMEAQRITAQTNAVLKSTGGVANVTTKEVQKLSEALMKKSGVDDETIQHGQNVLLTFTKVRNEVGKGNDMFNQATKATLDLSVALGKDMQSSAIMVGKALNAPEKGLTSLSRAGVQFTVEQKRMVKQMVAAGDTMGAQKIIMKELETQFGGSAAAAGKTFGGQINIAKQRLSNFAGEMVERSIPVIQDLVRWVNTSLVPALKGIWRFIDENLIPIWKTLAGVWRDAFTAVGKVLAENEPELRRILGLAKDIGKALLWLVREVVVPVLKPILTKVLPQALNATIEVLDTFAKLIDKIVSGIKWVVDNAKKVKGAFSFLPGVGDAYDPTFRPTTGYQTDGSVNLMGASPVMAPFAAAAAGYGLAVTSGLRPGAITANGTPSDHGIGKALDVAGGAAAMASFFKSLIGNRSVKQAFYDPLGSIFGGAWNSYREGGHSDHVHVATYDQGGVLKPGWTMAYNGTGRNEYVSRSAGPTYISLVLENGSEIARWLFDPLKSENTRRTRHGKGLT